VHSRARAWYGRRTWHWRDWPAEVLLECKRRAGERISVVIPARDEERTVAGVVGSLRADLVERVPLVDEVVVIDSDSADGTATVAASAGAHKHQTDHDLAPMAAELLIVAERRRQQPGGPMPASPRLQQFVRENAQVRPVARAVPVQERPPVAVQFSGGQPSRHGGRR
jgi:glycosyltransferase involved in cell wall biosynthesis